MADKINVTVWNEGRHEKKSEKIRNVYPKGIHGAIAEGLGAHGDVNVRTATLDEPEHGLTDDVLNNTDVLIWWAHIAHADVRDDIVEKIQKRVLSGMGLIILHSGHFSKIFRKLLGTHCSLQWREADEKARVWTVAPGHPIAQGLDKQFLIPKEEMYGEPFAIPEPDQLVFISWFEGGDVFRSGCCFERGNGKIFYFAHGHETYPIYYQPEIRKVIKNAVHWARPVLMADTGACPNAKEPLEKIG